MADLHNESPKEDSERSNTMHDRDEIVSDSLHGEYVHDAEHRSDTSSDSASSQADVFTNVDLDDDMSQMLTFSGVTDTMRNGDSDVAHDVHVSENDVNADGAAPAESSELESLSQFAEHITAEHSIAHLGNGEISTENSVNSYSSVGDSKLSDNTSLAETMANTLTPELPRRENQQEDTAAGEHNDVTQAMAQVDDVSRETAATNVFPNTLPTAEDAATSVLNASEGISTQDEFAMINEPDALTAENPYPTFLEQISDRVDDEQYRNSAPIRAALPISTKRMFTIAIISLLLIGVLGVGLYFWHQHQNENAMREAMESCVSAQNDYNDALTKLNKAQVAAENTALVTEGQVDDSMTISNLRQALDNASRVDLKTDCSDSLSRAELYSHANDYRNQANAVMSLATTITTSQKAVEKSMKAHDISSAKNDLTMHISDAQNLLSQIRATDNVTEFNTLQQAVSDANIALHDSQGTAKSFKKADKTLQKAMENAKKNVLADLQKRKEEEQRKQEEEEQRKQDSNSSNSSSQSSNSSSNSSSYSNSSSGSSNSSSNSGQSSSYDDGDVYYDYSTLG